MKRTKKPGPTPHRSPKLPASSSVVLEPNYDNLFRQFFHDLPYRERDLLDRLMNNDRDLESLQAFIYALTLSLMTATSVAKIQQLRNHLSDFLAKLDAMNRARASRKES